MPKFSKVALKKMNQYRPGVPVVSAEGDFAGYISGLADIGDDGNNKLLVFVDGVWLDGRVTDQVVFDVRDLEIIET